MVSRLHILCLGLGILSTVMGCTTTPPPMAPLRATLAPAAPAAPKRKPAAKAATPKAAPAKEAAPPAAAKKAAPPAAKFQFKNVPAGSYNLIAQTQGREGQLRSTVPLTVADRPIRGLQVTLRPGGNLDGRLKVDVATQALIKANAVAAVIFLALGGLMGLLVALTR